MTREQLDAIRARARSIEANKPQNAVWLFVRQDVPALLAEVERLTAERAAARYMFEGICGEFERTIAHADWVAAGSKGMSVPFHGDFASVAQLPGVVGRMRWWVREMRRALPDPEDKS